MTDYKSKFMYHTKCFVIILWIFDITLGSAASYFKSENITVSGIIGFVWAALIIAAFFILWKRLSAEESKADKLKLLPFAILPYGVNVAIGTIINSFSGLLPDSLPWYYYEIYSAISSTAALLFGLLYLVKWSGSYAELYAGKHTLVFPPEYRLRNKWWFSFVALLIASLIMSITTAVLPFVLNERASDSPDFSSFIYDIAYYGLLILLFKSAFKNIDSNTRRLFHPIIITASSVISLASVAFNYFTLKMSEAVLNLASQLDTILDNIYELDMNAVLDIYKQLLLPMLAGLVLLAAEILAFYLVYRCLKVYDYIPELNKGEK